MNLTRFVSLISLPQARLGGLLITATLLLIPASGLTSDSPGWAAACFGLAAGAYLCSAALMIKHRIGC